MVVTFYKNVSERTHFIVMKVLSCPELLSYQGPVSLLQFTSYSMNSTFYTHTYFKSLFSNEKLEVNHSEETGP